MASAASVLRRVAAVLLGFIATIVVVVVLAIWIMSATPWGHEKVRTFALSTLRGMVHGQVTIGRITGNLLTGLTVHDFAIRDSSGAPFLAADELSARYALWPLLHKKI